jgi:alkylation response protein AidB-like acyl-CoA dehydrogenase
MNFDLGPDERALREAIRELCARRFDLADLRANGMDAGRWAALEDAGVFTLRVPEDDGGLGLGMTHAAVAFEELGRALVPGPVLETHVARAHGVSAAPSGLIERDAQTIDHVEHVRAIIVLDADGAARLEPTDVEVEPVEAPLDPFTPAHRIGRLGDGERIGGPEAAGRMRTEATVLTAAMLTGIAAATTDAAVAYAKEREQFGKPIGSFQAVKHLCADMYVRTEVARAAVYAAACVLDDPGAGDTARAVAGAKLLAGEAAVANGKTSIQVHGGMGFTWEVDQHLYLKRAAVLRNAFGGTHAHEEAMAACL